MGISPVLWQFLVKWLTNSALFPPEASTAAPWMDSLYFFLLGMTVTGVVLVARDRHDVLAALPQERASGGHADRRLDAAGSDLDDHSAGQFFWWRLCGARCCTSASTTRRSTR